MPVISATLLGIICALLIRPSTVYANYVSLNRSASYRNEQLVTATEVFSHTYYLPLAYSTATYSAPSSLFVMGKSPTPIYWGAFVDGQAPSTSNMQPGGVYDTFEKLVGKHMAIIHWGQPWIMNGNYLNFYTPGFDNVRAHGSIPLLDWGSWYLGEGKDQPAFRLSAIYSGTYDGFIRQWALAAKAWSHPFFLRFDWEMNGTWQFPWAEQINGNQPGDYIKAWRHVHDIFTSAGATNVTWVWCPNISSPVTRSMSSLYPGDAYVDWTCLDGYNQYSTWLGFNSIFTGSGVNWIYDSYQQLLALAPTKPIMIGEFASLEAGDGGAAKAAWITDALSSQIPSRFPAIKAVVWFDWDAGDPANTFPVDSSSASASAFASAISSQYYDTNRYANLKNSPIPPAK